MRTRKKGISYHTQLIWEKERERERKKRMRKKELF